MNSYTNIKNILRLIMTACIAILTIASSPSFALGKLGHQLTCQLAFEQLQPASQKEIMRVLNTMSTEALAHLNKYNHSESKAPMTYAKACTWADAIKKQPKFERFKSWHYINVKRDKSFIDRKNCHNNCVTQAVTYHQEQLTSSKNDQQKRQALMFLGHWLGDIHQPLHVSFTSDLGGNKTKIIFQDDKCTNLHWLWDQCLLTEQIETNDDQIRYEYLYQKLSKILNKNQKNGNAKKWQNDDVYHWASESLNIARMPEFGYCSIKNNGMCEVNTPQPYQLMNGYQEHFAPVINERIVKASVRLAHRLEQSL
jgi:hypothetical protein